MMTLVLLHGKDLPRFLGKLIIMVIIDDDDDDEDDDDDDGGGDNLLHGNNGPW